MPFLSLSVHPSIHNILVGSVSLEQFERFSLNFGVVISVRRCAEPMTQLPRLEARVTIKGHGI